MFAQTTLARKILLSKTIFFVDFDGTVFTSDKKIITAPFYNLQIKHILQKKYHIPLVIVTGRATWSTKAELETKLLGLPKPDAIIAGAGTLIYYRFPNGQLGTDISWENVMKQSPLQWTNVETMLWNQEILLQKIHCGLLPKMQILPKTIDKYIVRLKVNEISIQQLLEWKRKFEKCFQDTIQVIFTEKLLLKNTETIFSGHVLLVPKKAGKQNAVKYILQQTNTFLPKDKNLLQSFCFGDATVDVPMLLLKPEAKKFTIQTYGVNITPLAKKLLQAQQNQNPQLHIIENPASPKAILEVLKTHSFSIQTRAKTQPFSPSQNSFSRQLLQPFEPLLDNIFDKTLTPNDISFKGLTMTKQAIDILYAEKNPTVLQKAKAWNLYLSGNLTDILDGIRARSYHLKFNQIPGQLVDVFCDRAKEFYQLEKRANKRDSEEYYQTLLSAISCILPSLARAQAEANGIIVKEQDTKGGYMLARTRRLFLSLFFDTIGLKNLSYETDKKIYETNIATFQNRLEKIPYREEPIEAGVKVKKHQSLERFILLTQLLQEENAIIEKILQKQANYLKKYEKEFKKDIEAYIKIDAEKLRQKYNIKDYSFLFKKS